MGSPSKNDFIERLAKEQREKQAETVKQARQWLEKHKFYNYEEEAVVDFLRSTKGQTLLQHLVKSKIPFAEIANLLNMSQRKLFDLKREYWELHDAYERGRAQSLDEVEEAMYKIAKGYTTPVETKREVLMPDGSIKETTEVKEQYILPNFYAQKYLLEQHRAMEYQNELAKRELDRNRINLEIVVIGQDELEMD